MFKNPSLVTRIAVGKAIGFALGILGFFLLPSVMPDASFMLRLGFLFWYATVGAIIGAFGVFTWHPILKLPMPWWVRAPIIGAWMNFVLTLFAYDKFAELMLIVFTADSMFTSPFWCVLEGAIVGLLIGYFATRLGGEGKETVN